ERLPCSLRIEIQTPRGLVTAPVYEISIEGILISGPDADKLAQNQSFAATLQDVGACKIRVGEHSKAGVQAQFERPDAALREMIETNGYLPVHNKIYSHPQRPGDVAWNTANSRNRRIFNDPAGLAAGRNLRTYLVQSYARDMGNGKMVMMREIDVPIHVRGRHWGGFRTAYRL